MSAERQKRTTVTIRESTHQRLKAVKPYESLSWDEFLRELADEYSGGVGSTAGSSGGR